MTVGSGAAGPSGGAGGGGLTIADVAARAGVSIRTVSRVLNRSPKVNGETRMRVEAAIRQMGFAPSARARGLATGRSFLIGLIHNDRNALVLDSVQRGIVAAAARRGYELVVHPTPAAAAAVAEDVAGFVRRSRVDGAVVLPPVSGIGGVATVLAAAGLPAVALSAVGLEGFRGVLISDERGAAAAVARHLVGLGHRRVAIVNGPGDAHSAAERRAGFAAALSAAGLPLMAEEEGDYGFDAGHAAGERLLRHRPRPTAIFAANDIMAAGVLKAAASLKIAVPAELSVVGFDGSLLARMLTPALTTVHRPLGEMAERATGHLINLIEGAAAATPLRADLTLVPGGSTGPAPRQAMS